MPLGPEGRRKHLPSGVVYNIPGHVGRCFKCSGPGIGPVKGDSPSKGEVSLVWRVYRVEILLTDVPSGRVVGQWQRCHLTHRLYVPSCNGLRGTGVGGWWGARGSTLSLTPRLHAVLRGRSTSAMVWAHIQVWSHALVQGPVWAGVAIHPCPVVRGLTRLCSLHYFPCVTRFAQ